MRAKKAAELLGLSEKQVLDIIREEKSLRIKKVRNTYWLTEKNLEDLRTVVERKAIIKSVKDNFINDNIELILDDNTREEVVLRYTKVFGCTLTTARTKLLNVSIYEKLRRWRQDDSRTNFKQECQEENGRVGY
jgi:hypothetical protein